MDGYNNVKNEHGNLTKYNFFQNINIHRETSQCRLKYHPALKLSPYLRCKIFERESSQALGWK